jgi:6-phosphogluconolactonase
MPAYKIRSTPWDERRDLLVAGDQVATIAVCTEHFIALAQEAIADHGAFFVALSGGSTPKTLFERLTSPTYRSRIDWSKVHLFWSDERSVPPDQKESNYHMAMEAGLKEMPIPPSHIHRMCAEKEIEKNAELYEKTVQTELKGRPFDLIMLGMGDDGHVASLFPESKGIDVTGKLVIANFVPHLSTWRMTFTFDCINSANAIAIYVLGSGKKYTLAKALSDSTPPLPAQRVGTKNHKALWIADEAASAELKNR